MPVLICVLVVHANLHSIGHALPRGEECGNLLNALELRCLVMPQVESGAGAHRLMPMSLDDVRHSAAPSRVGASYRVVRSLFIRKFAKNCWSVLKSSSDYSSSATGIQVVKIFRSNQTKA
jgi:hypothetical protein